MEIRKYLEWNDNKQLKYQNLWGIASTVLRGKFVDVKCTEFLKKKEKLKVVI